MSDAGRSSPLELGHNNPPEVIELASGVVREISSWMADNPVIQSEEAVREMKPYIDRAKACIKDLEAERDTKVRPLNDKVAHINGSYRGPRRMLDDLLDEMLARGEVFIKAEKARRQAILQAAQDRADEAMRLAEEAERIERERLDDAAKGEIGIDVAEITAKADEAFEDYEKAEREAKRAVVESNVKIRGGFDRAIGLRKTETLHVSEPFVAVMMMGITPDIKDAILKSARAWRKVHGKLPDGITSTVEEHL